MQTSAHACITLVSPVVACLPKMRALPAIDPSLTTACAPRSPGSTLVLSGLARQGSRSSRAPSARMRSTRAPSTRAPSTMIEINSGAVDLWAQSTWAPSVCTWRVSLAVVSGAWAPTAVRSPLCRSTGSLRRGPEPSLLCSSGWFAFVACCSVAAVVRQLLLWVMCGSCVLV